jgi:hypothetical protein
MGDYSSVGVPDFGLVEGLMLFMLIVVWVIYSSVGAQT